MPLPTGVYAAAITPRRLGLQDINLGVMWDLIDFLGERKVQGIVLLGATGEFVHFSNSEKMRMMGLAPKRSRVPIFINVSHSTLDGAVELAQAAAASGAAGVLLMPPYFFRYSDDAIRAFYEEFAEESDIPIPTLLYHIPQFGNGIPADVAAHLLRNNIVQGIKDSSGDRGYMARLQELRKEHEFGLLAGNDSIFAESRVAGGLSGVISGVACAVPELIVALDKAITAGNQDAATLLDGRLQEFIEQIERFPVPVGIREAATLRGLKLGPHASPSSPEQEHAAGEFRDWFKGWLRDVLDECKRA